MSLSPYTRMSLKVTQVIDLKKAIAPVALIASKAIIHISREGLSLNASQPDSSIAVVVRIHSSKFVDYWWDTDTYAEINSTELDSILGTIPRGSVTITYDNHGGRHLTFMFCVPEEDRSPTVSGVIHRSIKLNEVAAGSRAHIIDDLTYACKTVVSITSASFKRIFTRLSLFGSTVNVSITCQQLKFSAVNQDIILEKENGECSIQDIAGDSRIQLSIGLEHLAAFLNASMLSEYVWILTPALPESPFMIYCSASQFGDVKFFFPSKMINIQESGLMDLNSLPNSIFLM